MDWSTWGVSWFGSWANSWGPIEVYDERRPKSTNRLRLLKISEGRAYLGHSKSLSRSNRVNAKGEVYVPPAPLVAPGMAVAVGRKAVSRKNNVSARGSACTRVVGRGSSHLTHLAHARGASSVTLRRGKSMSLFGITDACGSAVTTLRTSSSSTNFDRLTAKGVKNLSTETIVAISHLYGRR